MTDISPLIDCHKNAKTIRRNISTGVDYPIKLDDYNDTDRLADLKAAMEKGNNKSASHPESIIALEKSYTKEVAKGWMLPIHPDILHKIDGIGVIPVGCTAQTTIDENGDKMDKRRTTHDCSQSLPSGFSINNTIKKEDLDDCIYGYCLLRLLHNIHNMRLNHPTEPILINKMDLDAAFRRLHVVLKFALLCTTIVNGIAYILFRLPFGSSPAPCNFCSISEFVIDAAQLLAQDTTWDPKTLHNPNKDKIPPPAQIYDDTITFDKASPLAIDIEDTSIYIDGFVDDIITVTLGFNHLLERATNAVPLILHCLFRPRDDKESIPRDDILSERKLKGEGALSEIKPVLGWNIDTRQFKVFLSAHKNQLWQQEIDEMIEQTKLGRRITTKTIESMEVRATLPETFEFVGCKYTLLPTSSILVRVSGTMIGRSVVEIYCG